MQDESYTPFMPGGEPMSCAHPRTPTRNRLELPTALRALHVCSCDRRTCISGGGRPTSEPRDPVKPSQDGPYSTLEAE